MTRLIEKGRSQNTFQILKGSEPGFGTNLLKCCSKDGWLKKKIKFVNSVKGCVSSFQFTTLLQKYKLLKVQTIVNKKKLYVYSCLLFT